MNWFWIFSADLLTQRLGNLQVVMLGNNLAWRSEFMISTALVVKRDLQYALDVVLPS
jgi:hypothetical protein